MRVAVTQFATTSSTQENLATCIRIINEAAVCKPTLIVLPEYSNTLSECSDHNQVWDAALEINGRFLQCIADQAIKHHCYIVINVTLRRDPSRDHQDGAIKSNITVTSCLFSPLGKLIQQKDKHALIGHEHDFYICTSETADVATTPYGKLGLLNGNDGITFEKSRELALGGAQLLCNSVNTFALDQSCLYDPVRAYENNVFIATANKVGALIYPVCHQVSHQESSQDFIAQSKANDFTTQTDQSSNSGVGNSQIICPSGSVLAQIKHNKEGYVFADIDLIGTGKKVGLHNKVRPDGSKVLKQLRPELYQALIEKINQSPLHKHALVDESIAKTANVAIYATYKSNEEAIEDVCHYIENNLSDIIQLPELFFIADKAITNDVEKRKKIASLSLQLITQISAVLRPFQYVCTSLVIEGIHQAVLINQQGLLATQQQLHFCNRYQWTSLGDKLTIIALPLEQGNITVAMLTADDANLPEIVKVAALSGIHLLLLPFDIQEPSEVEYNILSLAAENRICVVAGSREKNFSNNLLDNEASSSPSNIKNQNKIKCQNSTGLIVNLTTDYAFLPQWRPRKFSGYINQPIVKYQYGKITKAVVHPIAACNK
jgi:predicted amidohydrolase